MLRVQGTCTLVPGEELQDEPCRKGDAVVMRLSWFPVTQEAEGGLPRRGSSWRQQEHSRDAEGSFLE